MPLDGCGRIIHYLRVSLTDRCNLRCIYCMGEDHVFQPRTALMADDELLTLIRLFADLGFDKFRLTGGEPTLRPHLVELVRSIAQIQGIESLTMTTNAMLLHRLAEPLKEAGLQRVNISLDTLDPLKFENIRRWSRFGDVWRGICAAEAAGLTPIKLNVVVVRGFNDDDLPALSRLTLEHPWQVRFIELMPFGEMTYFAQQRFMSDLEIRERIEAECGPLTPVNNGLLDGEARLYQLPNAQGSIGVISSVTQPFCASCSRVRLTADGLLRLCLLRDTEIDLLTPLRRGVSHDVLKQMILNGIHGKPRGHGLAERIVPHHRLMSQIGG